MTRSMKKKLEILQLRFSRDHLFFKILMSFLKHSKLTIKFKVHGTCIPSQLPKLTGFTYFKKSLEPYSSALKE